MFIDSHAHIDDGRFDEDREEIIEAIKKNDVELFINVGADLSSSIRSVRLSEEYDFIYASVGVHPHEADSMDDNTVDVLRTFARKEKVVAIGEIGLDYHYDNSPRDIQRKRFREQIRLAKEIDLPIIVHSRDAAGDTMDILREEQDGSLRGVLHCYSGSVEQAKEYIDLGFYISLAGPVTFKNARVPKEVAKEVDLDRLLIETDSPYLTPEPYRGKRNNPIYVRHVAEKIAELRDMPVEEIGKITSKNTKELFRI